MTKTENNNQLKLRVCDKFPEGSIVIFEITEFSYNTVYDKLRLTRVPKTSSIYSVVSIERWLVTDKRIGLYRSVSLKVSLVRPTARCEVSRSKNLLLSYGLHVEMEDNSIQMKKDLQMFVYQLRINAEVQVIEMVCCHLFPLACVAFERFAISVY